jgi:DNA primase
VTRYTDESRDRVRDAADMVAVVSERTELRRAGPNSYFGICPFHDERTASFHVSPDDKLYHCFGCQESGDVFKFVMATKSLDFTGALELLAERFGVRLEREAEDPAAEARSLRRKRLFALLDRAATYYARYLWKASEAQDARDYLLGRGFTTQTLGQFRVGYAPVGWDRMLRNSRGAGYSDEELLAVGLAHRSRGQQEQLYDRFRERIMFPSCDGRGRVLGFGARAMRASQPPKYLNTADGELYHKREQLYGVDLARADAARAGRMILVEGYTDVLALHQAGLLNAVGIMGTALTEEQVGVLRRVVGVLELCLDADRAGQDAMLRAARLAAGSRLELRVVPLPEGADPAELIEREGADRLRELVGASVPFAAFQVERILERAQLGSAEGRDRALDQLRPVLGELPASVLRDELSQRVAARLELSEGRLAALLAGGTRPASAAGADRAPRASGATVSIDPAVRTERAFLVLCVALPEPGKRALAAIDPDEHLTSEPLRRAARHLAGQGELPLSGLPAEDEELARLLAELLERAGRLPAVTPEQLEQQRLYLELARLDRAIRRARREERFELPALAEQREAVLEAIHTLGRAIEKAV